MISAYINKIVQLSGLRDSSDHPRKYFSAARNTLHLYISRQIQLYSASNYATSV